MQVHYDEGSSEPHRPRVMRSVREVRGEALTGVRAGQPLSREIILIPGADGVHYAEGNIGRVIASAADPAWSQTLACTEALCTGTGRSPV